MSRLSSLLVAGVVAVVAVACFSPVVAADHQHVVPHAEQHRHAAQVHQGPTKTEGVEVVQLGSVDLAQVKEVAGKQVRARLITIKPGGKVAVHQHHDRPGLAQILSGVAVEYRGLQAIHHHPGSVAFEKSGDTHWWHNPGTEDVRALVIDVIAREGAAGR